MDRAVPVYQQRPERRGVSRRSVIDEAKVKVPVIDLADLLSGPAKMRRMGDEWVARCPLPDHEDKTPSFTVNPEKNLWFCHGCLCGGDVVELARYAWGYSRPEAAMAAAQLLHEFGHEIPPRPTNWYRKQERQKGLRDAAEQIRINSLHRRLYLRLFMPMIERIQDDDERKSEAERIWEETADLARLVYQRMREGAPL